MKKFFAKASKPFAINPELANDPSAKKASKNGYSASTKPNVDVGSTPHITTGLQPKYTVPAVPHPCPHDHLAIGIVQEGLLIRPYDPRTPKKVPNAGPASFLKVSWKTGEVVELHWNGDRRARGDSGASEAAALLEKVDWDEAVIVYGIVGVLELFSCMYPLYLGIWFADMSQGSYLLIISSREEVGNGVYLEDCNGYPI